jgi:Ca-activated chloride channel family protein
MRQRWRAVLVGLVVAFVGRDEGAGVFAQGTFRAGVDLVSVNVTVTDKDLRYVPDLDRDDFMVLENGVRQNLTFFGRTDVPLEMALLIDTSASMDRAMTTAQEAAIGFVQQLRSSDLATVVDFDSTVRTLQGLTRDGLALEAAIRETRAGGATALFNAVYITLKELNKRPRNEQGRPRRLAMVVLSDGDDTSSVVSFDDVLELASRSDTVIYTIGLGARDPMVRRMGNQDGDFVLKRLAQQTGGRAFFPLEAKDLAAVYSEIKAELACQYSLAYESTNAITDGNFRQIAVRVSRPDVVVRTRPGYYASKK